MVDLDRFDRDFKEVNNLRTSLPGMVILPDVKVTFPKKDLAPTEFIEVKAKIPEDYFGDLCKPRDYPHFLTQLLTQEFYSQRSKSAQLGLRLRAFNRAQDPGSFNIQPKHGYFEVPFLAHNINPYYRIQLPVEPVPLVRFFLPTYDPIKGQDLVSVAQKAFTECDFSFLYQNEMSLEEIEGSKMREELLNPDYPLAIDRVVLTIRSFGRFKKSGKIDLRQLLGLPSRNRQEVDQLLGLTFRPDYQEDGAVWRVIIGQTDPALFDEQTAAVIDSTLVDNPHDDFITHVNSALIDPSWGSSNPDGLPIRVEQEYIGPITYVPKKIHLALYRV